MIAIIHHTGSQCPLILYFGTQKTLTEPDCGCLFATHEKIKSVLTERSPQSAQLLENKTWNDFRE